MIRRRLVAFAAAALGAVVFFALWPHHKPAAIDAMFPPALAQALQSWVTPSATPYNFTGASPSGTVVASGNVGSTLTIDLPNPATVGANWAMAATTRNGQAIILTPPGGVGIVGGGRSLASLTLPATTGQNYEWAVLISDGTNFQVASVSAWTASWNGFQSYIPTRFETPGGPGYAATQVDNGYVIRPPAGGLTVTLPTSGLALGWTIGIEEASIAQPISLTTSGQIETPGNNFSSTYSPPLGRLMIVEWDGSYFHVLNAADPATSLHYSTDAALAGLATIAGEVVERCGVYGLGDSPCVHYEATALSCPLNAGAGDGGSQVPSASGCLEVMLPPGGKMDIADWGAPSTPTLAACSATSGSRNLTLDQPWSFENGQTIDCLGAGAAQTVGTPPTPSIAVVGTTGSSTYCARIAYLGANLQVGPWSAETATFIGNAVLGTAQDLSAPAQGLEIGWAAPPSSVLGVVVYLGGCSGGETFLGVGDPGAGRFQYYGTGAQNVPHWMIGGAATGAGQSQMLQATIVSGAGTNTLVVNTTAGTTTAALPAWADATAAIQAAHASGIQHLVAGPGTYYVTAGIVNQTQGQSLTGCGEGCTILTQEGGFPLYSILTPPSAPTSPDCGVDTCTIAAPVGQEIGRLSIERLDATGWGFVDNASYSRVHDIAVLDDFDSAYIGGTNSMAWPKFADVLWKSPRRGSLGVELNGVLATVTAPRLQRVSIGNCWTCTNELWLTGHVATLKSEDTALYQSNGPELELDNVYSATAGTRLNQFLRLGANACPTTCVYIENVNPTNSPAAPPQQATINNTFIQSYFQEVRGANSSAIYLAPGTRGTIISDSLILGISNQYLMGASIAGVDDWGFGDQLIGDEIYGSANEAVVCEAGANTQIVGGGDQGYVTANPYPTANIGVLLASGCLGPVVSGQWYGQSGDIVDDTGTPCSSQIGDRPRCSIDYEIDSPSGGTSLAAATYTQMYGRVPPAATVVYLSGPGSTIRFDTAANISAAMGALNSIALWFKNERSPNATASFNLLPAVGDGSNLTVSGSGSSVPVGDWSICTLTKGTPMTAVCTQ